MVFLAEVLARLLLHNLQRGLHLIPEASGELFVAVIIRITRFRGDGETGRDWQSRVGHFRDPRAFSSE